MPLSMTRRNKRALERVFEFFRSIDFIKPIFPDIGRAREFDYIRVNRHRKRNVAQLRDLGQMAKHTKPTEPHLISRE